VTAAWPIAPGFIEGRCRYLVADPTGITGDRCRSTASRQRSDLPPFTPTATSTTTGHGTFDLHRERR
jgi:hypothetical protein